MRDVAALSDAVNHRQFAILLLHAVPDLLAIDGAVKLNGTANQRRVGNGKRGQPTATRKPLAPDDAHQTSRHAHPENHPSPAQLLFLARVLTASAHMSKHPDNP